MLPCRTKKRETVSRMEKAGPFDCYWQACGETTDKIKKSWRVQKRHGPLSPCQVWCVMVVQEGHRKLSNFIVVGMKERRLDSVCGGSEGAWMMDSGRTALVGWS